MNGEFVQIRQEFLMLGEKRVAFWDHAGDCEVASARAIHYLQVVILFVQASRAVPSSIEIDGSILVGAM